MRQLCAVENQRWYLGHQFRHASGRLKLEAKVAISGPDSYELGVGEKGILRDRESTDHGERREERVELARLWMWDASWHVL
jgi:hypothetical protein